MHDRAQRAVGHVLGSDVGDHGAGRYVVKGGHAALDQLKDGAELHSNAPRALASYTIGWRRVTSLRRCRSSAHGTVLKDLDDQLSQFA